MHLQAGCQPPIKLEEKEEEEGEAEEEEEEEEEGKKIGQRLPRKEEHGGMRSIL